MCDRWEDAEDDIKPVGRQGRVARLGIAGFVACAVAGEQQQQQNSADHGGHGRVVIVDSKREQRKAAEKHSVPPPAMAAPQAAGRSAAPSAAASAAAAAAAAAAAVPSLPRPAAPADALVPPPGTLLLVSKHGEQLQQIILTQRLTLLGRLPCNDVVADHPSMSRQHAAIFVRRKQLHQQQQEQAGGLEAVVWDLGSAHGTVVQGNRICRGQQCALAAGDLMQFGASTRTYSLQLGQTAATTATSAAAAAGAACEAAAAVDGDAAPPSKQKRARVKSADDAEEDGAAAAAVEGTPSAAADWSGQEAKRHKLEQVLGYSDGRIFTPKVGPQAAAPGSQGRFAYLLDSKVVIKPALGKQQQLQQRDKQQESQAQQEQQQEQPTSGEAAAHGSSRGGSDQPAANSREGGMATTGGIGTAAAVAAAAAVNATAQQRTLQQQQQEGSVALAAVGAAAGDDAQAAEQQPGVPAAGDSLGRSGSTSMACSWSGSAAAMLMPPQLRQKFAGTQQQQQQQQQHRLQAKQKPGHSVAMSSLYGQLPASKPKP